MTTGAQSYYHGTGRRKCAIAQVRIMSGVGTIIINGKPLEDAVPVQALRQMLVEPLRVAGLANKLNATVKVIGGGTTSQAGAVRHGLARALVASDEGLRPALRRAGLMTRDPRVKERKKYGLKKARKAPQYTKR
jgi:small subunit ribosomal protein S9